MRSARRLVRGIVLAALVAAVVGACSEAPRPRRSRRRGDRRVDRARPAQPEKTQAPAQPEQAREPEAAAQPGQQSEPEAAPQPGQQSEPDETVRPKRERGPALPLREAFEVSGFTVGPGEELSTPPGRVQGALTSRKALEPGWHVFMAEYRTESLPPLGALNVNVADGGGRSRLSREEWLRAASDWSPLRVYFKTERRGNVTARFKGRERMTGGTRLHVRDPKIERLELSEGVELLPNGRFAGGTVGEFPSTWGWKYNISKDDDYRLVADKTFRTGDKVMRLTTDPEKTERTLVSTNMPLPTEGTLQLTFWARSDTPRTSITGWCFGDGWKWQYMVNGSYELSTSWKKYSCSGSCPTKIQKWPYFWARFDYHGEGGSYADLADISLKWFPPGVTVVDGGDAKGGVDPKGSVWMGVPGRNMLFNPGFELGWAGWRTAHYMKKMETTMTYARAEPGGPVKGAGMKGGTALRLSAGTSFDSYCFPLKKGQKYTVSGYFKAEKPDASGGFSVVSCTWKWYGHSAEGLSTERWKRDSFTFTWAHDLVKDRGYLRLGGRNCLIDRIQLQKGDLTDYEPPPVTLGLNSLEGQDNIFVRGKEEAQLEFVAIPSGAVTAVAKAVVSVKDAWEREAWKKEFTVRPGRDLREVIDVPTGTLGTFEADMKAVDARGKVLGVSTSRFAVIEPPEPERRKWQSAFAVCYEAPRYPPWVVEREMPALELMGAHWARFFTRFHHKSKTPPADYVAAIKRQVEPLNKRGIEPIACLAVYPSEARKRIVDVVNPDPDALRQYEEHVRELVSAFKGTVEYWEVLNEPNLWRYGSGPMKGKRSIPPEKYIKILEAAWKGIKAADPDMKVVGCCTNGTGFKWFERCMELGSGKYMDVYSYHSYRSSPDTPDCYPDLVKLRGILDKHGFKGPMINSEQYFAADLYALPGNVEETRRGYYVRGHEELRAAGRTVRNYIHHAAAGVPYCAFGIGVSHFSLGGSDPYFLYDLYAAHNAATRFLDTAGRGEMVKMGAAMRAFLFPEARGGPLVTVNAPSAEVKGRMKLKGEYVAYDIMGNPIPRRAIEAEGIPVRTDPCYVRFARGVSPDRIREYLKNAEVMGLGDPFAVQVSLSGEKELTVSVSNRYKNALSGKVVLQDVPKGWAARLREKTFTDLEPGRTERLAFRFDSTDVKNLGSYPVTVLVESGEEFVRQEAVLSPLFARALRQVRADGDLSEWRRAEWIELGDEHVSKAFSARLKRTGDADLSARLACGWSSDFFALALEVTDDRHVPGELALEAWKGDSVQVYFDQKNNASAWIGGKRGYDTDDIAYAVSLIGGTAVAYLEKAGSERYIGEANLSTGVDKDVDVAVVRRGGKTVYEVKFPKNTLPEAVLREGRGFGFSLLVNDNDGKGRKTGLTLAPKGEEPYSAPHKFKDLLFVPAASIR